MSEIIADQMAEVLHDEEFVQNLAEEHPSIARAILDSVRDIIRKIRQMFADFGGFRSEYNEATLSQLDLLKEAESLLLNAVKQAENARADAMLGIEDNTARFSLKNKNISINTRIPFIENNSYIKVKKSDYKSLEALRNKARELHRGTYENRATGYKADITGETIGKILNPNGKNPKYNFVKYINNLNAATKLPELFENAVYIETKNNEKAKNTNKQIKGFHHFIAPIYMNGESYRVRIVAREKVNSDTLYIVDTEILPIKNGSSIGRQYKTSQFVSIPFDITIPSLVNGVKIYDYTNQKYDTYNADDVKFSLSSPVPDVIPLREEIINSSLDNPVEGYEDIESMPNARGGKNKVISELTAEFETRMRKDISNLRFLRRES